MSDGTVFDERTAADLIKIVRHFRRTGLIGDGMSGMSAVLNPPTPYYVHNDSGETIPAYACMQVTGTEEIGDQNFLLVDKPVDTNGDAGSFLFNGPREIADNEEGIAQFGPVVRAFKDTGTVTAGEHWIPVSGQWYIAQDDAGQFVAAGLDDVEDDVLRVFMPGGEGGQSKIVQSTTAISARSGTTVGSATCNVFKLVSNVITSTSESVVVKNLDPIAIPSSIYFLAVKENVSGFWIARHPGIIDMRLSGSDLQYTLDKINWTTWHTAASCP